MSGPDSGKYYPVGLKVAGRECLVVGGGRVAERKVRSLLEYGAKVRIVSPLLTPFLGRLAERGDLKWQERKFSALLFRQPVLAFALTDDIALNRRVARLAKSRGVPVNVANPGKDSSFILPAVLRRRSFTVAVSTDGRSPARAKRIRDRLERIL